MPTPHKHFLQIEGMTQKKLVELLDQAQAFIDPKTFKVKRPPLLKDKIVANLFFENSTRTRCSFEIAAKQLSADVINFAVDTSSTHKGESVLDTVRNLAAMGVDIFVIRHSEPGSVAKIAKAMQNGFAVLNAGDGNHAHPSQALLDMLTIRQCKADFSQLRVAIVGDILHSRVARSQIQALKILGVQAIHAIGPEALLPDSLSKQGVKCFTKLSAGLDGCDAVIALRIQKERFSDLLQSELSSDHEYFIHYGLHKDTVKFAKPDAIIMHPGPINRGIEIDSDLADGAQSVILKQVRNGVAVRMALLANAI